MTREAAPRGQITFDLDFLTNSVSFSLLDIEEVGEFNGRGFFRAFKDGNPIHTTSWASLVVAELVVFGNHSANAVSVTLPDFANKLVFDFGGSAALGELVIDRDLPEPGSLFLLGLGLLVLGAARARSRE